MTSTAYSALGSPAVYPTGQRGFFTAVTYISIGAVLNVYSCICCCFNIETLFLNFPLNGRIRSKFSSSLQSCNSVRYKSLYPATVSSDVRMPEVS